MKQMFVEKSKNGGRKFKLIIHKPNVVGPIAAGVLNKGSKPSLDYTAVDQRQSDSGSAQVSDVFAKVLGHEA